MGDDRPPQVTARFMDSIQGIPREDWDRLVGPDDSPFNEWTFLRAAEVDSTTPRNATQPCHMTLWLDDRLVAALPMFIKGDGRGEFIYDWHWYQFSMRAGIPYYPKALAMSPFTPVTGRRFLTDPALDRASLVRAAAQVVQDWARDVGLNSVHFLFLDQEEVDHLQPLGYLHRLSFQPRWTNAEYGCFDEFLARFRSKDRVKIKRQRRRLDEAGVRVEVLVGDAIGEADWDAMFSYYSRTCALYGTGSDYLKRGTWERLFDEWRHRLVLFLARQGQERVGASLCVQKGDALYGRYWGSCRDIDSLYFNLAFYEPLALSVERGWRRFYAGFGNSKTKYDRGLDPCLTHSLHVLFDDGLREAIARHLEEDRLDVQLAIQRQQQRSKLKPGQVS